MRSGYRCCDYIARLDGVFDAVLAWHAFAFKNGAEFFRVRVGVRGKRSMSRRRLIKAARQLLHADHVGDPRSLYCIASGVKIIAHGGVGNIEYG